MKAIELNYSTPDGRKTAFVFVGDDGLVDSEKGLTELVAAVNERKHGRGVDASSITAFLDFSRPCPRPEWAIFREAYAAELDAADAAGCTHCTKTNITKKFIRILYDQSLIDAANERAILPETTNP